MTTTTGRYRYLRDGSEVPVDETFVVEHQVRGTLVTGRRAAPGTLLAVECLYPVSGGADCTLTWTSELDGTAPRIDARYRVEPGGAIRWEREQGGATTSGVVTPAADGAAASFFPLMRVFSGRSVLPLAHAAPEPLPVLVPDIRDPRAVDAFLAPLLGDRRAASVTPGATLVDGVERACSVVDYRGGSYDTDAMVYVDDGGLLLRYTWPQPGVGDWDVVLSDVDGAWPAPVEW